DVIEVYYGDNRFGTMTDSGTATLKPRPRVRPLLTFLPLNAQESHGVAVPTPSVPEDFEEKAALGSGSQINGNYRMYSSVGDLRPQALEGDDLDEDIPPPPSVPPPPPPTESPQPKPCPEPHLTFPRSFKVPPPAPARSSSIPVQESQPVRQEPFPRQPHARPPLPPCFTIRPAAKAHAGREAEQRNSPPRQALAKPAVPTPPPLSPKPGPGLSQGTNPAGRRSPLPGSEVEKVPQPKTAERDSPPKSESLSANDLDLPPPDYPTCEDDWRDASNMSRLRHELSALLRSPRREERPPEKPAAPRPVDVSTDRASSHEPSLNGPQLTGPAGKDVGLPAGGESEKKEVPSSPPSAKGGSPSAALPAPESNPAVQTRSVMKIRNELEAVLSLKKEGKPALGLGGQKQGTEDGGSTPRVRKSPPDLRKSLPVPGDSVLPKPAPSPLPAPVAAAEKDETEHEDHPAPAASKATENLTPAPGSLNDSVSPPDPPQGPAEKLPAPTSPSPPVSPAQSPAAQPNAAIFPPVRGERVERGSPMALLLAARQRAQRGRQGGEVGAAPRVKPPPKLSSASSDTTSTTFYRHESKPYSFTVVPRPPVAGTEGSGWSKPPSFSSSSEQGRDVRAA
ncbi:PREDICTED: uncharacterized protein C6orf132 homolog, partial [Leptosomus discolor]|uniref:uncharacterized protein C6orf132 homolog n=1 Tax=Leptosomus discolor TaxID=188344 RepID=UPI00052253A8